jgi:calcium-dependent protein kinase
MFESKADNAEVKIIDFGLSKKYLDPTTVVRDRVGTLYTMAPEVIEGIPYSFKVDTFSLGVIAYMLLSKSKPFWGSTKSDVARMVKQCIYNFNMKVWDTITDDAKDFVSNLLTRSISDRLSAEEAKHHPWLAKISLLSNTKPDQTLMTHVEESLIRYSDSGEFKKVVLNVLAQRTTTDDIQELRTAFQFIDTGNNGFITHKEFKVQLSRFNFDEAELGKIFNSVDVGKSGHIMYNEFIAATLETQHQIEETNLRDAFDRLDSDGNGFISKKNLCCILGENCTDEYVNKVINEVDTNGDGLISYDEFIAAFRLQKKNNLIEKGL